MSLWPTSPPFSTAHLSHQPPPYHNHSQPLLPRHRLVHETFFTSALGLQEPTSNFLKRNVALTRGSGAQYRVAFGLSDDLKCMNNLVCIAEALEHGIQ